MSDPTDLRRRRLVALQMQMQMRAQQSGGAPSVDNTAQDAGGGVWDTIRRNVIGGSPAGQETPGERLGAAVGDAGRAFFPGVARGAAELVGLPGTLQDGMDYLARRVGVMPDSAPPSTISGQALRGYMGSATGGATEYRGDTRTGRIAGTVGEFMPGALGAGARGLLAYGLAPGVASELAGEATEGTALEPYARAGAAIGTGLLAGPLVGAPSVRAPGTSAEQRAAADALRAQGVNPTAGQVTGSPTLRRMEGTVTPRPSQLAATTRAAMRSIGSEADRATPATLRAAQRQITGAMDDALQGVSVRPSAAIAQSADDVVRQYLIDAPSASVVPRVRAMADEIIDAATNPVANQIDLSTLRTWRSALGRMSQSNDEATRTAAHGLRRIIDEATDEALRAAGRSDDIARLAQSREQYRNFLAVSDASTRAGSDAGILSPSQLNQAIIRTQGRDAYAVGRGTDLMDLSRNASDVLRPMPTVEAGGIRRLPGIPEMGSTGAGAAAGYALGGPPGAIAGGILGYGAPRFGQAMMTSPQMQQIMMNPQFSAGNTARSVPGLLAGN